jgi:VIT1/CCC1 family predicted Fe2+/Mn2+ transporter
MPQTPHVEQHFTAGQVVRDVVIGMADGLTVPFALAAGLSGAAAANKIIVTAGLAEVAAGAIAMGLGGFLAARSDAEHYRSERAREEHEIATVPHIEEAEIREILEEYGIQNDESAPVIAALKRDPKRWTDFMMRFELGLEAPDPGRARQSAVTIGGAYVVGGMIPLVPYMVFDEISRALSVSAMATGIALFVFGFVKGKFTGAPRLRSALETLFVGGVAALAAFFIARAIGG